MRQSSKIAAFISNILNFVMNHQCLSNASSAKSYFHQGLSIPLFASKLGATINVRTLNLNMLIFRRTLRTSSYNLVKHYLNHPEFNFSKYLNVMAWKLKSNLPQAKKLMVLQYLTHFNAELLLQCISQFLASDVQFYALLKFQ